ncbi:endonuclease/exonuclease/phosphatase family protein [Xylariaceae sp. FL0594]|nr:endonuclease/exonuclease/phosphatase family protein [Xylariaceae sp. FL0594]
MQTRVQKAIQQAVALRKQPNSIPWKDDEPWPQPFYSWDTEEETWQPVSANSSSHESVSTSIDTLALYSWNIDLMLPVPESRMNTALAHLEKLFDQLPSVSTTAVVINLQECIPSDLVTIGRQAWVRDRFYMTDTDATNWASAAYGTTTLIDRRLDVVSCFRVHYSHTQMERDALFVDIVLPTGKDTRAQKLRLGNSHLESLVSEPPLRPSQVRVMGSYMRESGVCSAIAAGDFNAIQPFDRLLHSENGLKDAYLEVGGQEDSEKGYTWGQQALRAQREQFGCSRMDKIFFCGSGLQLQSFERFGADVELDQDKRDQRAQLLSLGFEKAWITDHLGVRAIFKLENTHRL